jgi:long-chain acyl-CoA synthetase
MQKPWLGQYGSRVPQHLPLPTRSMIDVFEQTAARIPDSPAVMHFDTPVSFAEVNTKADRFAAWLADVGVGKGDRVAISLQNDPEFLIAQYGAWKRGAVVVPLTAMFKVKELQYHLADSGASVYIGESPFATIRSVDKAELNRIVEQDARTPAPRVEVAPDDLAYLVYTSGTTGSPKGAMGHHRNIAFNADVFRTWLDVSERDVVLGIAPLTHITGVVAQMALSALTGAPLVLYHRFDARETLRLIEKWKVTTAVAAITAYIALLKETRDPDLSSFRKCCTGGAPVPPSIVEQFEKRYGVLIHNTYGLTESNSPSHLTPLGARGPVDPISGALAIGLPIPNSHAKIVSAEDPSKDLDIGETGEIALAGPMMFSGYWEKPEATARAFHNGYFLTGDIASMDERGWFYLVDRKKDMIVASGFKVWPREVEDVLYQHPAVREAAVIGEPDEYRGETVKAVVALRKPVAKEELIDFCKERMAAYKYPRIVEIVDEIPKTPSGKFLRRALRSGGG